MESQTILKLWHPSWGSKELHKPMNGPIGRWRPREDLDWRMGLKGCRRSLRLRLRRLYHPERIQKALKNLWKPYLAMLDLTKATTPSPKYQFGPWPRLIRPYRTTSRQQDMEHTKEAICISQLFFLSTALGTLQDVEKLAEQRFPWFCSMSLQMDLSWGSMSIHLTNLWQDVPSLGSLSIHLADLLQIAFSLSSFQSCSGKGGPSFSELVFFGKLFLFCVPQSKPLKPNYPHNKFHQTSCMPNFLQQILTAPPTPNTTGSHFPKNHPKSVLK